MVTRHSPERARRITVARLHGIAIDYAGGYREGLTRVRTLAELAAVSTDPDLLAEAAAVHAMADTWYAIAAVELLVEAGADQVLIERHIADHGPDGGWLLAGPDAGRRAS